MPRSRTPEKNWRSERLRIKGTPEAPIQILGILGEMKTLIKTDVGSENR